MLEGKQMISKKLLSEVLQKEVVKVKEIENTTLIYGCAVHDGWYDEINIYEFAHKCKEWAKLKYFIDIDSHSGCARWGAEAVSHNGRPSVFYEQVFIGRTETDAIFKACEWIMEQIR